MKVTPGHLSLHRDGSSRRRRQCASSQTRSAVRDPGRCGTPSWKRFAAAWRVTVPVYEELQSGDAAATPTVFAHDIAATQAPVLIPERGNRVAHDWATSAADVSPASHRTLARASLHQPSSRQTAEPASAKTESFGTSSRSAAVSQDFESSAFWEALYFDGECQRARARRSTRRA